MRLLKAVTWLCAIVTILIGVWIVLSPETHSGGLVTSLGVLSAALVSVIVIRGRRKNTAESTSENTDANAD
ncbi:MAG: hypothetical protein ACTH6N_14190 [Brachybacterium tyrofermentans]|uniref:hypothetical protein n=1 Tax=Brachybacterium tyrofermentans TaxID=47848 RepID=UPI001865ECD5|nr:hypothetical protein [Brachybacterium tyrofermentans]